MNAMDAEAWELVSCSTMLVLICKEELRVGHIVHSTYWWRAVSRVFASEGLVVTLAYHRGACPWPLNRNRKLIRTVQEGFLRELVKCVVSVLNVLYSRGPAR
jgi:hypothetical protein